MKKIINWFWYDTSNYSIMVIKVPDDFPPNDLIVNEHTLEKYIKQIENKEFNPPKWWKRCIS